MNRSSLAYYELSPRSDGPVCVKKAWLRENRARFCCPGCGVAYAKSSPLNPLIMDTRGGSSRFRLPLEFIFGVDYGVIRDDLLAVLEPEASKDLNLGALLDENGRQISDYHTAQAKIPAAVRGGPESKNNGVCDKCGRRRYYPMPHGYGYLLRSTFPKDVPILRVRKGIAVSQTIRDRIVAAGLARGMYVVKLLVLDEPEDGLPLDLKFCENI